MEIVQITKIIKTGNSLCVVIPKNILNALNLQRGDQVVFGIYDDHSLVVRKLQVGELQAIKLEKK